jgi:hypothetical protein
MARSPLQVDNAAIICPARRHCDVIHAMLRSELNYGYPARKTGAQPEIALAAWPRL